MPTERRADAQRNRDAVLAAAQRVVQRDGAAALRIGDVARAAGVGAGTIYRGFGSKRDLLLELLGERERELQDAVISGPPPLGPGAPPAERLVAFLLALSDLVGDHRELLLAADESSPLARFGQATHAGWRQHTAILLRQLHPRPTRSCSPTSCSRPSPPLCTSTCSTSAGSPQTRSAPRSSATRGCSAAASRGYSHVVGMICGPDRRGWGRTASAGGRQPIKLRRVAPGAARRPGDHSHSMVPGGLDVMSRTTRLTSRSSLIMREAICSRRS